MSPVAIIRGPWTMSQFLISCFPTCDIPPGTDNSKVLIFNKATHFRLEAEFMPVQEAMEQLLRYMRKLS